ncbi:endoglucanase [Paenibacillus sp. BIHB 4019]|uniref:Endoglucanase n=2 Tax=Paenibacillus sp. BIHB 4019 TaxID=1870819 RepID=A0A1B2DQM8_9BACL|nr:endoglucanase [Paenibacillus sp. BIHB 4019]
MFSIFSIVLFAQVFVSNTPTYGWQGMPPISKLHVSGNKLVNSNGEPVILSGWFQPTAGYFTYGSSNYYLNLNDNNVHYSVLAYLKDVTDTLTNTSPKYGNSYGWYTNFVRLCIDTDYLGDVAAGTYNFAGLQAATQDIVIPFINYARTKGVYVAIDFNLTFDNGHSTTSENLAKFKEIWGYLASQTGIKSADNVMFELINEPIQSYANGHWGGDYNNTSDPDFVDHWNVLKDFQNEIIATIRNTGADNVIWAAGLGYDEFYNETVNYPITDPLNNYGYAVHWYPAYGGAFDDRAKLQAIWNQNIAVSASAYPILISETAWWKKLSGDDEYWGLFNGSSEGFGKNTKAIFTAAGNVNMVGGTSGDLFEPGPRSSNGDPTGGLKWDGNAARDGMSRFIFEWFYERAQSYPINGISNGIVSGETYKIVSRSSGKVIDIPWGQDVNGVQLQQWSDLGGKAQQWIVTNMGGGNYMIKSASATNKVIEVRNSTNYDWEKIQLMTDNGTSAQRFKINTLGNGYWSIINTKSNKAIDLFAGSLDDSAQLIQYGYLGNTSQQWKFVRVN